MVAIALRFVDATKSQSPASKRHAFWTAASYADAGTPRITNAFALTDTWPAGIFAAAQIAPAPVSSGRMWNIHASVPSPIVSASPRSPGATSSAA